MPNAIPMQLLVTSDATSADLHIMGDITRGSFWFGKDDTDTDANDIAQALAELPETCGDITVHINSMGGEVAEGIAIYNALKASKARVTTVCEGFACSIASVIFMAGDVRVMRNASLLMIHEAWMSATGDAGDLRKAADDLETITELSKRAYMEHATDALTRDMLDQLMADETWVLPEQALEWGLATDVDDLDDDEDRDEVEQSAMRSLMRRLSSPFAQECVVEVMTPTLTDEQVQDIAELVAREIAKQAAPEPSPKPEPDPEPQPKSFMQRAALLFAD